VVDDQIGCPTYAPDIADAIIAVARQISSGSWTDRYSGVTHLAGPDELTWCDFARHILHSPEAPVKRHVAVDPISTAEYPTPAERPRNSRLCCDRLASVFDVRLPPLGSSLEKCLKRLRDN
jgi:dTDP-4-dehydrorhamnose reductase